MTLSAPHKDEIRALLRDADYDLRMMPQEDIEISMQSATVLSDADREHFDILFDLASDFLLDPASESRYVAPAASAEGHLLETGALTRALKQVENFVNAPIHTIKSAGLKALHSPAIYEQPVRRAATRVVVAHPRERLFAFLFDTLIVVLLAAFFTVPFLYVKTGSLFGIFEDLTSGDSLIFLSALSVFSQLFMILLVVFPLTMLKLYGRTPGLTALHLKLMCDNGTAIRTENILVRTLTLPLQLVTFGYLPTLLHKRTLCDRLSRTAVCKL